MKQQADSLSFRPSNEHDSRLERGRVMVVDTAVSNLLQFETLDDSIAKTAEAELVTRESAQPDTSTSIMDARALVDAAY